MVICLVVAAGMLSGCGARGGLDPPPGADPPKKDDPFVLDKII
jgi:predicted small lipoprotein YifL